MITHKSVKDVSLANSSGKSPVNAFDDKTLKIVDTSRKMIRIIFLWKQREILSKRNLE